MILLYNILSFIKRPCDFNIAFYMFVLLKIQILNFLHTKSDLNSNSFSLYHLNIVLKIKPPFNERNVICYTLNSCTLFNIIVIKVFGEKFKLKFSK